MSVSGIGLAIAGPTLSPDDREESTIAVGCNPAQEKWNCVLVGSATGSGPRVDLAGVGQSRGGFAPASTVVAVCLGSQAPVLATAMVSAPWTTRIGGKPGILAPGPHHSRPQR